MLPCYMFKLTLPDNVAMLHIQANFPIISFAAPVTIGTAVEREHIQQSTGCGIDSLFVRKASVYKIMQKKEVKYRLVIQ